MKPYFTLLFIILLSGRVLGQDSVVVKYPQSYKAVKGGVHLVSTLIPMAYGAYERRKEHLSWQASAGFVLPRSYMVDDSLKGTAYGYMARIQGRRYHFQRPSQAHNFYVGAELFYHYYKMPIVGWFTDSATGTLHYEDRYVANKHSFGAAGTLGVQRRFLQRFIADLSVGAGFKVMQTTQRGRSNITDVYDANDITLQGLESELGTKFIIAMPVQLSLGYYFR